MDMNHRMDELAKDIQRTIEANKEVLEKRKEMDRIIDETRSRNDRKPVQEKGLVIPDFLKKK